MVPVILSFYFVLCLMVAILARGSRLGFFRGLLFSIMITPFLMILYLLIFTTLESEKARG